MAASTASPFVLLLLAAAAGLAGASDHIVGGHLGWNLNINYTPWIQNQTFYVGDLISFRYQKYIYNVFEVNQTGYDNCTTEGAMGNWTKGKDFISLPEAKRYYFICSSYCLQGMKISILVEPLPTPSSQPSHANHTAPGTPSAAAMTPSFLHREIRLTSFVVALAVILGSVLL